jgi:tetratricopeptide (TPR) repeat protein
VVVLRGLGGQGKTQISLEYCRRTREKKFRSIFWIDANSETTVKKSFETVAEKIKDPGESVPDSATVDFVLDKLREWENPWLMVFDNYDDVENFENIQDFIPDGEHGCVIVTSRHLDSMSLATDPENAIDLLGLAESEALELLYKICDVKKTESTTPHATAIVDRLACHPLAITQAGSYIKKRRVPLDKFLDDYNRRTKDILQHTPQLTQYRRSLNDSQRETSLNVFTTWELSFEQLLNSTSSGQHKADLLTLFAFFDCNDITEHLFSAYCKMSQQYPKHYLWPVPYLEACLDDECRWNSDSFRDVLIDLANLSLLQSWSVGDDKFCHCSLHPLVQDWIRLRTGPEDFRNCVRIAAKVLEATLRECWRQRSFDLKLSVRQPLLSHISMYKENRRIMEVGAHDPSSVFDDTFHQTEDRIALFLANTGRYDEAIAIQTKVVSSIEVIYGAEHPNTLSYINNLANFYVEQGRYDLAEPMLRRVLESREKTFGQDHSDTLLSVYNLANLLRSTAKFEAAEAMARRALAGREKLLGPEHPDTLRSLSGLAGILRLQDKYKEAEQYGRRALEGREKVLGPNHNDTLVSVGVLGTIFWGQWRLHAAERMIRRELEGKENVLGREHPETLRAIGNLGNILKDQGKLEDAQKMTRRALEGMEKLLGKEHSSTLISVWNLAVVEAERKEYASANILYRRACSGFLKTLGDGNATTIRCMKEYDRMLEKMKAKSDLASGTVPLE